MQYKAYLEKLSGLWSNHRYLITLVAFLVFLAFFDESSLMRRIKVKRECMELKKEIADYESQYASDSIRLHELTYNREALEKYARERYKMKQPEEVVYIIK